MKDEDCKDRAQEQLASLKRDMRKTMEDATVRAVHKVMAEFEAKSDERLMEMPEKFAGFDVVVDASLPPGTMKFEQPAPKIEANRPEPLTGGDERRHIICLCPDCTKPAQQQGPVAWAFLNGQYAHIVWGKQRPDDEIHTIPLYTSPPAKQQEPVDEIGKIVMFGGDLKEVSWKNGKMPPVGSVLYTSPPAQRKPLTDEQIADILPDDDTPMSLGEAFVKFARAIEAAHNIKENT